LAGAKPILPFPGLRRPSLSSDAAGVDRATLRKGQSAAAPFWDSIELLLTAFSAKASAAYFRHAVMLQREGNLI
jgi:hypothetical protein